MQLDGLAMEVKAECKHKRTCYATEGQLWCEDCRMLIGKPEAKPKCKHEEVYGKKAPHCPDCKPQPATPLAAETMKESANKAEKVGYVQDGKVYCGCGRFIHSGECDSQPTTPLAEEHKKKHIDPETGEYTIANQLHDYFIDNMRDEDMDFGDGNSWVAINFAEMAIKFFRSHSSKDKILISRKVAEECYSRFRTLGDRSFLGQLIEEIGRNL